MKSLYEIKLYNAVNDWELRKLKKGEKVTFMTPSFYDFYDFYNTKIRNQYNYVETNKGFKGILVTRKTMGILK